MANRHPSFRQDSARAFIIATFLAAAACLFLAFTHWRPDETIRFLCYLALAVLASPLKVSLPGGTLSVNFLFTLLGILELNLPETLLLGIAGTLVQFYWRPTRQIKPIQLIFNLSQVTVCSAAAYGAYWFVSIHILHAPGPLALLCAALTHFACNTLATSTVIGLTENIPISKVWSDSYLWSFPYYMVGAAIAGLISFLNSHIGYQSSLLILPPIYLLYRSYRLYLGKLETEKKHAEQVSNLHLRTIEALALAIGAKDQTTGEHLQRVRVYAMELAKELGLTADETEALRAASVLHDIGKLAVPEHIISKPGKLTPEEFEKMKIHPIVGAEILEQVEFPYPVVPIVRAHHEKWDGSGYPSGLKGEAIPMGARILSAVDCLDALASDRQYRRALPLDEAMARVASESGTSFDPRVTEILGRRYIELEKLAHAHPIKVPPKLSLDVKVSRGLAPDAGFAESERPAEPAHASNHDVAILVAEARKEAQTLCDLSRQNSSLLAPEDIFSLISGRVSRLIPYDSIVIYLLRNEVLIPQFVAGQNHKLFASLRIPVGEGLSGWVAQNGKPIVNGNPAVEPGYLNDPVNYSTLRSALAIPVSGATGTIAVLAIYCSNPDAFTREQLQVLEALSSNLGPAIESANKALLEKNKATRSAAAR
ncbi:MAG TPA: HD domain-containing phosphohydrolase [Candidatus Sulfotelmatobacter sp.]|jgi:putative nucleotidyltransferase with HDIG domain